MLREAIQREIEQINAEFLLLACDDEIGGRILKILGADQRVQAMLLGAGANGLRTATYCGAPLIKFTETADALVGRERCNWPRPKGILVPRRLQDFTLYTLECARVLALRNETVASIFFSISPRRVERISLMSYSDIRAMSRRRDPLLRLWVAHKPIIWSRLLIGDALPDDRALKIARMSSMTMLCGE